MIATLTVVRRPRRCTHLARPVTGDRIDTLCGLSVPAADADCESTDMAGGATSRLVQWLKVRLDDTTCLRCTRMAGVILLCYGSRDKGVPAL